MLRAILEDLAFHDPTNNNGSGDVGYLITNPSEFFASQQTITDTRVSRLPITYRNQTITQQDFIEFILNDVYTDVMKRYAFSPNDTLGLAMITDLLTSLIANVNNQMTDGTSYTITRDMTMSVTYDKTTLEDNDIAYLASMGEADITGFFNIVERLLLGVAYQDTLATVEADLISDTVKYKGYSPNSFTLNKERRLGHIYDGVNIDAIVPPYITFTLYKMGGYTMDVKIWTSSIQFTNEYPYSAIVDIIPQTDLTTLLNLNTLSNIYAALSEASQTFVEYLSGKIVNGSSYSGLVNYVVPYINPTDGQAYNTSFLLLYRGVAPAALASKNAIKNFLINSGVGTEDAWKALYPSLFISNAYYVYPLWDECFSTANKQVFRSLISYVKENSVLSTISTFNIDVDTSVKEYMNVAYNAAFLMILPDKQNENTATLSSQYTDYSRVTATSDVYVTLSSSTKDLITLINQAMAKAYGETNDLTIVAIGTKNYVKFTTSDKEFYVMTKDSYDTTFTP
jgi:hypothetical protein